MDALLPEDVHFLAQVNRLVRAYVDHMEACRLRDGLRQVLAVSSLGNGYLQSTKPWVAVKQADTR